MGRRPADSGAAGSDWLTGGSGNDLFVFNSALNAATNVDRISDFSAPNDTISLENAIFPALVAPGTLAASAFYVGEAAHDASDRIVYNPATGFVNYGRDGTGTAAAVHFATLDAGLSITNTDFLVI